MNDPRETIEIEGVTFKKHPDGFHYAWIGDLHLSVGWDFYTGRGDFTFAVEADDFCRRIEGPSYLDAFPTFEAAARAAIALARTA